MAYFNAPTLGVWLLDLSLLPPGPKGKAVVGEEVVENDGVYRPTDVPYPVHLAEEGIDHD